MRSLIVSLLFILSTLSPHLTLASNVKGVHECRPYSFSITKDIYTTSEIYQIHSRTKDTYPGSVKKSAFRIRTNYDLSDKNGWQATGITRIVSLGALYPWAKDIDIYDTRGVQIGLIDGNIATLESAKFNIYEYDDAGTATEIGIAYANPSFNRFVILPSMGNPHPIAEMNRDTSDHSWTVTVHYPEQIDDRIMRIFAGFVVDYQDKFISIDSDTGH